MFPDHMFPAFWFWMSGLHMLLALKDSIRRELRGKKTLWDALDILLSLSLSLLFLYLGCRP